MGLAPKDDSLSTFVSTIMPHVSCVNIMVVAGGIYLHV
jgi:hypothetical protein